jgi:hypothetical protein
MSGFGPNQVVLVPPSRIAKFAAWTHAALAMVAVYCVTQIWNYTPIEQMPSPDSLAFGATALPPLLALWAGRRIIRGARAAQLLAGGLVIALALYATAFLMVLSAADSEPMAPILLIVASLWIAGGLFALLIAVWATGRMTRGKAAP